MESNPHVKSILSTRLYEVLVCTDSCSLESLRRYLFIFSGNHVDTEREFIDSCPLSSEIVDPNLGVRNSSAETRLWVWLVFAVTITVFVGGKTFVTTLWGQKAINEVLTISQVVVPFLR